MVAWENAADSLLERTLDDSANRRATLPEACLALEECLSTSLRLARGLVIDKAAIAANVEKFGPFAATERVLMVLVRAGADRQQMHERLRQHSLKAWEAVKAGRPNPLAASLAADPALLAHVQPARLRELMDARAYVGTAPERAAALAAEIRRVLS
jgi:adenylosuccinate lyase